MDGTLGLLGCTAGGGGGVPSGGSTTGSILTVSRGDNHNNSSNNMVMSAEVSSSNPVEDDDSGDGDDSDGLELGLGLSIGGGLKAKTAATTAAATPCWGQYARILTAKDFPSMLSKQPNCSSSSSSVNIPNSSTSGTKRTATDSVSPPNGNSVVGWPPIRRAHRMPTLVTQTKSSNEEFSSLAEEQKSKNNTSNKTSKYSQEKKGIVNKYLSIKVNMDGTLIGRKVDLNTHSSYEMLAQTLEEMFWGRRSSTEAGGPSKLLDGTSEFVLTYEDKDGDWMLVGDVPWQMFLGSVKRLRIMRNSESNGLAPRFQENSGRRRTNAI